MTFAKDPLREELIEAFHEARIRHLDADEFADALLSGPLAKHLADRDEIPLWSDAELDADPQKLITHLEQQCRGFIAERNEARAERDALEAENARLRAAGVTSCLP